MVQDGEIVFADGASGSVCFSLFSVCLFLLLGSYISMLEQLLGISLQLPLSTLRWPLSGHLPRQMLMSDLHGDLQAF